MTFLKRIASLLLVAAALASAGCTNLVVGKPIASDNLKRITAGRTTTTDIQEWFGSPLRQHQTETGKIFVYRYINPKTNACQELIISFSEDDSVCVVSKQGL